MMTQLDLPYAVRVRLKNRDIIQTTMNASYPMTEQDYRRVEAQLSERDGRQPGPHSVMATWVYEHATAAGLDVASVFVDNAAPC